MADRHDTDAASWLDQDAGPLVRSFALTGGRARPRASLDILAYVVATDTARRISAQIHPEQRALLAYASSPVSLAELASAVDLPVGVVRVLLGDLIELSAIAVIPPASRGSDLADQTLKAVINALRAH